VSATTIGACSCLDSSSLWRISAFCETESTENSFACKHHNDVNLVEAVLHMGASDLAFAG